jgi:hypothetical protein
MQSASKAASIILIIMELRMRSNVNGKIEIGVGMEKFEREKVGSGMFFFPSIPLRMRVIEQGFKFDRFIR